MNKGFVLIQARNKVKMDFIMCWFPAADVKLLRMWKLDSEKAVIIWVAPLLDSLNIKLNICIYVNLFGWSHEGIWWGSTDKAKSEMGFL